MLYILITLVSRLLKRDINLSFLLILFINTFSRFVYTSLDIN